MYTGVDFADVQQGVLSAGRQLRLIPGTEGLYPHSFEARSGGVLTISTSHTSSPASPSWNYVVYVDSNCDQQIDSDPAIWAGPVSMSAGDRVCFVVKQFVPHNASHGAQDKITVTAKFDYDNTYAEAPLTVIYQQDNLGIVDASPPQKVTLIKVVDRVTVFPGDTLVYTITYTNSGPVPISSFVIHDRTPAYTVYLSATYAELPNDLTACAVAAPAIGATGDVTWSFTGDLQPGSEGTVSYSVRVE